MDRTDIFTTVLLGVVAVAAGADPLRLFLYSAAVAAVCLMVLGLISLIGDR